MTCLGFLKRPGFEERIEGKSEAITGVSLALAVVSHPSMGGGFDVILSGRVCAAKWSAIFQC